MATSCRRLIWKPIQASRIRESSERIGAHLPSPLPPVCPEHLPARCPSVRDGRRAWSGRRANRRIVLCYLPTDGPCVMSPLVSAGAAEADLVERGGGLDGTQDRERAGGCPARVQEVAAPQQRSGRTPLVCPNEPLSIAGRTDAGTPGAATCRPQYPVGDPLEEVSHHVEGTTRRHAAAAAPADHEPCWTCPRRTNTPDVGVSPRGGCSDAEEGGGQGSESPATAIVHGRVQRRGRRLGAAGGPDDSD